MHPAAARRAQFAGAFSLAALALFVALLGALHLLQPAEHPIWETPSHYVSGPYGWLMTVAFFVGAAGSWLLALGLHLGGPETTSKDAGVVCIGGFGVGAALAGIFPTAPVAGFPYNLWVHNLSAFFGFVLFVAAMFLFTRAFRQCSRWRGWTGYSKTVGSLGLATLVGLMATAGWGPDGLFERLLIAAMLAWAIGAALGILRGTAQPNA